MALEQDKREMRRTDSILDHEKCFSSFHFEEELQKSLSSLQQLFPLSFSPELPPSQGETEERVSSLSFSYQDQFKKAEEISLVTATCLCDCLQAFGISLSLLSSLSHLAKTEGKRVIIGFEAKQEVEKMDKLVSPSPSLLSSLVDWAFPSQEDQWLVSVSFSVFVLVRGGSLSSSSSSTTTQKHSFMEGKAEGIVFVPVGSPPPAPPVTFFSDLDSLSFDLTWLLLHLEFPSPPPPPFSSSFSGSDDSSSSSSPPSFEEERQWKVSFKINLHHHDQPIEEKRDLPAPLSPLSPVRNPEISQYVGWLFGLFCWVARIHTRFNHFLFLLMKSQIQRVERSTNSPKEKISFRFLEQETFDPICPLFFLPSSSSPTSTGQCHSSTPFDQILQEHRRHVKRLWEGFVCERTSTTKEEESCFLQKIDDENNTFWKLENILKQMRDLSKTSLQGLRYLEKKASRQLKKVIGKRVGERDFELYMGFHFRKMFKEAYQPKDFAFGIRAGQSCSTEGTITIASKLSGKATQMFSRRTQANSPMFINLDATTKVPFTGERYVHWWFQTRFGLFPSSSEELVNPWEDIPYSTPFDQWKKGREEEEEEEEEYELLCQSNNLGCYIILLGKIWGCDHLDVTHGMVVSGRELVRIPLLLESLPTPKEFQDRIGSLSPTQKAFASAYRSLQLSGTLFGVCVIQVKPHVEKLLGLPVSSLSKEIELTNQILSLFLEFGISSDLMKVEEERNRGREIEGEDRKSKYDQNLIQIVSMNVERLMQMINQERESILKDQRKKKIEEKRRKLKEMKRRQAERRRREETERQKLELQRDMVKRLDEILLRGEKLEDLVEKSNDLSFQSRTFCNKSSSLSLNPFSSFQPSSLWGSSPKPQPPPQHSSSSQPSELPECELPEPEPEPPLESESLESEPLELELKQDSPPDPESKQQQTDFIQQPTLRSSPLLQQQEDYTKLPSQLDHAFGQLDQSDAVRAVTITPHSEWEIQSHSEALPPPSGRRRKSSSLTSKDLESEKKCALDLLDILSRSGDQTLYSAELHVVLCSRHSFLDSLWRTLIQRNTNPIEMMEKSALIGSSVILDANPSLMLKEGKMK